MSSPMAKCHTCKKLHLLVEYLGQDCSSAEPPPCDDTCAAFVSISSYISSDIVSQHDMLIDSQAVDAGVFGRPPHPAASCTIGELSDIIGRRFLVKDFQGATFTIMHVVLGFSYRYLSEVSGVPRTTIRRKVAQAFREKQQ